MMESTNYFSVTNSDYYPDHQAIRTQIGTDGDWDQFWREYNTLYHEPMNNFDVGWINPPDQAMTMGQITDSEQSARAYQLPPDPAWQFDLPQFGSDMFLPPVYIDPSPTPPWTDPSTSTSTSNSSSPSATSSRTCTSAPSTSSTPSSAPSSTSSSERSFSCDYCPQIFPQRCLLNRHTNTHTKPYRCPMTKCKARRATRRDLKRHMVVHDPVSGPAFHCTVEGCDSAPAKGFNRRDNLKRHVEKVHLRL